jgi:prevent-host-death family protein
MTIKVISAVEARTHFGEIMKRSLKKGERFIVEKSGIPMVVILNANEYERIIHEREERFKILDRIKAKLPGISSEEVEKDVKETIRKIREESA